MKKLRFTLSEDGKISLMKYGLSLVATLAVGAVMILLQGENPAAAFVEIFRGAFGSRAAIGNTLHWRCPACWWGRRRWWLSNPAS